MGTTRDYIDFVCDCVRGCGTVRCRKMFGEYALYAGDKVVALVCDNQLFVKPTPGGRAFIGSPVEAPPYPGAKNSFLIEDAFEDREWITDLIRITERELPAPKPKKPRR